MSVCDKELKFIFVEHVCVIKIQEPDGELTMTLKPLLFLQFNELYLDSVFWGKKKHTTGYPV